MFYWRIITFFCYMYLSGELQCSSAKCPVCSLFTFFVCEDSDQIAQMSRLISVFSRTVRKIPFHSMQNQTGTPFKVCKVSKDIDLNGDSTLSN